MTVTSVTAARASEVLAGPKLSVYILTIDSNVTLKMNPFKIVCYDIFLSVLFP